VELPAGPYDRGEPAEQRRRLAAAFEADYREKYQRTPPSVAIELISIRIVVSVPVEEASAAGPRATVAEGRPKGRRSVTFPGFGGAAEATIWTRAALAPGMVVAGPALVEEASSTLAIPPGAQAEVRTTGTIVVTLP
jgi:N-methylhydantoinase A